MAAPQDRPLALVTGGARGIGRAIVERLVEDGFAVTILDREREAATALAAELSAGGASVTFEPVDLADHDRLATLADGLPPARVLVNNAGIFENKPFFELAGADFTRMMNVNVTALFLLSQAVARRMARGGRIINIASRTFLGARNHAHYVASKAAVVGLTRAMAMELLERGIMVNAVAPGAVATEMVAQQSAEARAALLALQPTGTLAAPADIANAVAFLASPRTDFIYGQVLMVDGGKSLGGGMGSEAVAMDERFDEIFDVVVVGSGAGGMASAITAAKAGLDVLLIEKSEFIGGSTAVSGGAMWVPENPHAAKVGHADTREAALAYVAAVLGNRLRPDLMRAFLDNGPEMVRFFERETALRFEARAYSLQPEQPGASRGGRTIDPAPYDGNDLGADFALLRPPLKEFTVLGGMMVNRKDIDALVGRFRNLANFRHSLKLLLQYGRDRLRHPRGTRLLMGNALAGRLLKSARQAGVDLRIRTEAAGLIRRDGAVIGLVAKTAQGERRIGARRGIVLASGGFPADAAMRAQHLPHAAVHRSMAPATDSGDGIRLGLSVGGGLRDDNIGAAFWTPVSVLKKPDGSEVRFPHLILDRAKPGLIAVDLQGRRFVNEATSYHGFVEAMHAAGAVPAFLVCDSVFLKKYGLGLVHPGLKTPKAFVEAGYLFEGDSIAALAQRLGVPAAALAEAVAGMNAAARSGRDEAFGKGSSEYNRYLGDPTHKPNACLGPIETGPFYAVRVWPGDIGTATGLICDPAARVLGAGEQPVPGLYAAGNDMNSIMAGAYPGAGITLGPALTFGFIAGRGLAAEPDRLPR